MPETTGTEPAAEAGTAGEQVHVVRRTAADHEQHETKEAGE